MPTWVGSTNKIIIVIYPRQITTCSGSVKSQNGSLREKNVIFSAVIVVQSIVPGMHAS